MPSCGCLMPRKSSHERKKKPQKRRIKRRRRLTSCRGKIIPSNWFQNKKNRSRQLSKKCSRNSGPSNKVRTRKLSDKNSSSTEKEISSLSITTRLNVNSAKFKMTQRSREIRNYLKQISSEKRPSSIWKKLRRLSADEKCWNYKSTTN